MRRVSILSLLSTLTLTFQSVSGSASITKEGLRAVASSRHLKKSPEKRECELSKKKDEVEFECKVKIDDANVTIHDEIDYTVKNKKGDGITIKVEYEQETETELQETEAETQYKIAFGHMIEYVSTSGGDAFDWEKDEIVQTFPLTEWGDFSDIIDSNDNITSSFSVTSKDGTATFTFTVSRASHGESITANKMKIDFLLTGFPWQRNDTYVALVSSIESKKSIEVEYEKNGKDEKTKDVIINFGVAENDTSGIIPFGEYTWDTTAEVKLDVNSTNSTSNNAETAATIIEVVATSPTSNTTSPNVTSAESEEVESIKYIAFSFIGDAAKSAAEFYWDPEAGVGYSSSDDGTLDGIWLSGAGNSGASHNAVASLSLIASVVGAMGFLVL